MLSTRAHAADYPPAIFALHGLTRADHAAITAALAQVSAWSFDHHVSCTGHLVLLITHHDTDTTLVVARDIAGFHIAIMQGDHLRSPATCYADLISLIAALRQLTTVSVRDHAHPDSGIHSLVEPIGIEPTTS